MKKRQFTITGKVIDTASKEGLALLTIEAWDKDLLLGDFLGKAKTDKEGTFTITFDNSKFQEFFMDQSPDIFFKIYKGKKRIADTRERVIHNADDTSTVVIALDTTAGDDGQSGEKVGYTVFGLVKLYDGLLVEAEVKVFGIGVNSEQLLAGTKSNAKGRYEVTFNAPLHTDIEVRAYVGEKVFSKSETHYNTIQKMEINLTGAAQFKGPSEYKRLEVRLGSYMEGIEPGDIGSEEIKYLANKTGSNAQQVALFAKALDFASDKIPSPFFYALFRAGTRTEPADVYRVNANTAMELFGKLQGELVSKDEVDPELLKQAYIETSTREILGSGSKLSVSDVDDMLSLTLDKDEDRAKFVQLYFHGDPDNAIDKTWETIEKAFGKDTTDQLKLDGKLGYLTFNNAALISKIKQETGINNDPAGMVSQGWYLADQLEELIDDSIPVPDAIKGKDKTEKRANYIKWVSGQLQLSYPNEVVAHQVDTAAINVKHRNEVQQALQFSDNGFKLGKYPINRHIKELRDSGINLSDDAQKELQSIHRSYALAPDLESMNFLMEKQLDSAFKIVNYSEKQFSDMYKQQFQESGEQAMMIYYKAEQDAGLVTNMAAAYGAQRVNKAPEIVSGPDASAGGIKVYPTLEKLFGALDYCSCGHCKSLLSPAAYLVSLLQFIDLDEDVIEGSNPIRRLFDRRPDIEYTQLSCENTHTVLPYIDLVNEILEYYVVHHDIDGFEGYNINEEMTSEALLANPQFVNDAAYQKLNAAYPMQLPFNRNLELLREFFAHFDTPLYEVMEKFREDEALESNSTNYSWRETLTEQLGLSPATYELFTDNTAYSVLSRYGITSGTLNGTIANAKEFCKRTDITYKELVDLLKTEFINPAARHITRLEALQKAFNSAKKDNASINATYGTTGLYSILHGIARGDAGLVSDINNLFPSGEIDADKFGGDLRQWIGDTHDEVMSLIFLSPVDQDSGTCDFGNLELKYGHPDQPDLEDMEYWKFIHFIRLWKKMGWSITQTDSTLKALYDHSAFDISEGDLSNLDNGFKDFFIKLALFNRVQDGLGLRSNREYNRSLALWADINTYGAHSLYKELFLTATVLDINDVYREDEYGNYLTDTSKKILDFSPSLQAAFSLTVDEWTLITTDLGFDSDTELSLANVSNIHRYSYLARKLKSSIDEFITLKELSGTDPFTTINYQNGDNFRTVEFIQFINLVKMINDSDFSVQDLKYLFQHTDETGNSQPTTADSLSFAKTLYLGLKEISDAYPAGEDLNEAQAQALVTSIYGQEYGAVIYSILAGTATFSTDYDHGSATLEAVITDITSKIGYDHFGKQLSFRGVMTLDNKNDLQAVAGVSAVFIAAVETLYDNSKAEYATFFAQHPEFQISYEAGNTFEDSIEGQLEPMVIALKQNYLKQTLAEALDLDVTFMETLLQGELATHGKYVIHAATENTAPVIRDFLAMGANGVSATYYDGAVIAGTPAGEAMITSIAFDGKENLLPENTSDPGSNISANWRFYMETPTNAQYNIFLDTDATEVLLGINGEEITMSRSGTQWGNATALEFSAGTWYEVEIRALNMHDHASFKWQQSEQLIEMVPESQLFAYNPVRDYLASYIKLLKAVRIIDGLALTQTEVAYFADDPDMKFGDNSLLEALPTREGPATATVEGFIERLRLLLQYTPLRSQLDVDDASLAEVLSDPLLEDENGALRLLQVTAWETEQLAPIIQRFTGELSTDAAVLYPLLMDRELFGKVASAYDLVKTIGVSAANLFNRTTVDPSFEDCTHLQSAMRAKYDHNNWLEVIQPISDRMRSRQRNALLSYILYQLSKHAETRHIDTLDKLYEFFLIDVEMSPCMKTSRIKQALSSTQLFIQRCLLNLEAGIEPSSINSEHWSWMKNYRVWEANRKIFLYPENWLDPSLRNTKSPFFKEFESELLQSDINEDRASTALLNYLEKLDKVTQLSIYGMCREDENIIHVIGKTSGKTCEYYHRIYDGTWSPWEKITLDIEEGPLIPVFWKDRLFLFWTTVLQKGQDSDLEDEDADNISKLNGPIKYRYEINLCWSEYYNGKWQVKRTSDFDMPVVAETTSKNFTSKLKLWYHINSDGPLDMFIDYHGMFRLYNKHSEPELRNDHWNAYLTILSSDDYARYMHTDQLRITYYSNESFYPSPVEADHTILGNTFYKTTDLAHLPIEEFADPVFVENYKHLFFLEIKKEEKYVDTWPSYGTELPDRNVCYKEAYFTPIPEEIIEVMGSIIPDSFDHPGNPIYDDFVFEGAIHITNPDRG